MNDTQLTGLKGGHLDATIYIWRRKVFVCASLKEPLFKYNQSQKGFVVFSSFSILQ